MNNETMALSNQLQQLTSANEELLRSKGKLMQEIIMLKKKVEAGEKNRLLVEQLQQQVNRLNEEVVDHLLDKSMLSAEIDELKKQLQSERREKEQATKELERIRTIKWYQRLIGKK